MKVVERMMRDEFVQLAIGPSCANAVSRCNTRYGTLWRSAPHIATCFNALQRSATRFNVLPHVATHYATLQSSQLSCDVR
jgi:hypothetical protein